MVMLSMRDTGGSGDAGSGGGVKSSSAPTDSQQDKLQEAGMLNRSQSEISSANHIGVHWWITNYCTYTCANNNLLCCYNQRDIFFFINKNIENCVGNYSFKLIKTKKKQFSKQGVTIKIIIGTLPIQQ